MPANVQCACGKTYRWKPELAGRKARCKACGGVVAFPAAEPAELTDDQVDQLIRDLPAHETTPSGAPIYRHEHRTRPFEAACGDDETISLVSDHIGRHIGQADNVFHEIISDLVHIDVHIVAPSEQRPWYTLITSGMSDRPMATPDGVEDAALAELAISLPPDWPLTKEAFEDERNYWPIHLLKAMARMPHEYETWLGWGHTVPNGEEAAAFAPDTRLCCALILSPVLPDKGFDKLQRPDGRPINFYSLVPIYREEMEFKLRHGAEKLVDRLADAGVTELLDVNRKNVCRKRFWLF